MAKEYSQLSWDAQLDDDCRQIVRLAVREDLDRTFDWTTVCLVPREARSVARVVARDAGVAAGLSAAACAIDEMQLDLAWSPLVGDGQPVAPGDCLATISGAARDLLTSERLLLNLIGRLSGIATLTRRFVDALQGTQARIYDTRKTTPGWRRLEKHAVRCGGGWNHRTGLFDGILIKDNHLAFGGPGGSTPSADGSAEPTARFSPAEAVRRARAWVQSSDTMAPTDLMIEIEVDTLDQLREVLPARPDIILLDNFSLDDLREAVALRDSEAQRDADASRDPTGSPVQLEASGGVRLETVAAIARTGVDRISAGALTHSAVNFDVGLDWGVR